MKKTAVVSVLLLAACSSTPKVSPLPAVDPLSVSQSSETNSSSAITSPAITHADEKETLVSSAGIEAGKLTNEANKLESEIRELERQSVYFDFDKYVVKPEYRNIFQKQAEFIKANKNDMVTIEGNADERGSSEYNLALGDKRANAVRKNLELLGIPRDQIKTISYGEEKPQMTCHEEKCWQENRRADFVHKHN